MIEEVTGSGAGDLMSRWWPGRRSGLVVAVLAVALVAARMATAPPAAGEVLVGFGFRDALWPDEAHRSLLDPVTGDTPVVLVSGDLHQGWLNGAALARFGHGGHPTGRIRESEFFAVVSPALQDAPTEALDGFVADAVTRAAARTTRASAALLPHSHLGAEARRIGVGLRRAHRRIG